MLKLCHTSYSKKSFNNKFGVPISLFNISNRDKIGIFEVGMDKKGEIDFLTKNNSLMLVLLQIFLMLILKILKI